jgi:hypothetical protein
MQVEEQVGMSKSQNGTTIALTKAAASLNVLLIPAENALVLC